MFYDSELEINQVINCVNDLQDRLQELYDSLSNAVINGRHARNIDALEKANNDVSLIQSVAQSILTDVKYQIQDVLSAEKQFLKDNE